MRGADYAFYELFVSISCVQWASGNVNCSGIYEKQDICEAPPPSRSRRRKLLENLDHTIPLPSKHTLLLAILLVHITRLLHMLCLWLGSLLVLCMAPHIPSSTCHLLREGMSGHTSVKWHGSLILLFSISAHHPAPS